MIRAILIIIIAFAAIPVSGQHIEQSLSGIAVKPFKRMIRPCCVFGYNLPAFGFNVHMGYTISGDKLGSHKFYGGKNEYNGIVYTRDAGFVDIGHVRDNADVVAYFSWVILRNQGKNFTLKTTHEAGKRVIEISLKDRELSSSDILILAQRITYELAVWHEIRTYYGVPTHFPVSEVQSAFSPEDLYSNLLGTYIGRWALESDGPYEQEVGKEIQKFFIKVGEVKTEEETKAAMDNVLGVWWQRVSLPSKKFLLSWNTEAYGELKPWIIPDHAKFFNTPTHLYPLPVPDVTESGIDLDELFTIRIKPVAKIPMKKIYTNQHKRELTQKDFAYIISYTERNLHVPKTQTQLKTKSAAHLPLPQ